MPARRPWCATAPTPARSTSSCRCAFEACPLGTAESIVNETVPAMRRCAAAAAAPAVAAPYPEQFPLLCRDAGSMSSAAPGGADRAERRGQDQSPGGDLVPGARARPAPRQAQRDRSPRRMRQRLGPVDASLRPPTVLIQIGTGRDARSESGERRLVRIDGAAAPRPGRAGPASPAWSGSRRRWIGCSSKARARGAGSSTVWCWASIPSMRRGSRPMSAAMRERLKLLRDGAGGSVLARGARRRDGGTRHRHRRRARAKRWPGSTRACAADRRAFPAGAAGGERRGRASGSSRCPRWPPRRNCAPRLPRNAASTATAARPLSARTAPISRCTMSATACRRALCSTGEQKALADRHSAGPCAAARGAARRRAAACCWTRSRRISMRRGAMRCSPKSSILEPRPG